MPTCLCFCAARRKRKILIEAVIQVSKKSPVLVLRLSAWGDIVQSRAALDWLVQQDFLVTLVVKPQFVEFARSFFPKITIYEFNPSQGEVRATNLLLDFFKEQNFVGVLDLHDTIRTKILRKRLLAERSSELILEIARKPRLQEWLIFIFRQRERFGLGRGGRAKLFLSAAQRFANKFAVAVNEPLSLGQYADPSDHSIESNNKTKLPAEYIVVAPGGAWSGKQWNAENFAEVAQSMARLFPVVVLGGEVDNQCAGIAIAAQSVAPESISLQGQTSMVESAAIVQRAKLFIGNDSGLGHVADAAGIPTIIVEGPTHPSLGYSVYSDRSVNVGANLICRPCSKNGRFCWRLGLRSCMSLVTPQIVISAAVDLLGSGHCSEVMTTAAQESK